MMAARTRAGAEQLARAAYLFLCGMCATTPAIAGVEREERAVAQHVGQETHSITLDGLLNEPAWQSARVIDLVQQSPNPEALTAYETRVRILVSSDAIYLGYECEDPEPGRIAIHSMRRDTDMAGDDSVSVV